MGNGDQKRFLFCFKMGEIEHAGSTERGALVIWRKKQMSPEQWWVVGIGVQCPQVMVVPSVQ